MPVCQINQLPGNRNKPKILFTLLLKGKKESVVKKKGIKESWTFREDQGKLDGNFIRDWINRQQRKSIKFL